MRSLAHPLLLLLPSLASAQIVTYYVVPPTSGCNGIWAVSGMTMNCGSPPYTYTMDPMGCAEMLGWTSDGDTLFIPLCAMPCSLIITNSDAIECTGTTDLPSSMASAAAVGDVDLAFVNGDLQVTSPRWVTSARLRITDAVGRSILQRDLGSGDRWIIPSPLQHAGVYLFTIDADGSRFVGRTLFNVR